MAVSRRRKAADWPGTDAIRRFRSVIRADLNTRKRRLAEPEDEPVLRLTPAQRVELVWPLTVQAWAFKTGVLDEPRLRRDSCRVVRGQG